MRLRNAIDHQLALCHTRLDRPGHWIFDEYCELGRDRRGRGRHAQPFADVAVAIERVRRNRKLVEPDQIISELAFGFWHQMLAKRQMFLWPDLAAAFPHAPNRSQSMIQQPVRRLRELCNRIGHHHKIWNLDVGERYAELLRVARYIDGDFGNSIDRRSRVMRLLD